MFKHILVATDGSERANKAVDAAIDFAKATGARMTVYHAVDAAVSSIYKDESYGVDAVALTQLGKRALAKGESIVAAATKIALAAGVQCDSLVNEPSSAAQGIIEAARQKSADIVFIASHGRGDLASLVLGSVTQKVLANSRIPVLVYR